MDIYHIRKDGTPGVCNSEIGKCSLGDISQHYSSLDQAEKAAQLQLAQEFGSFLAYDKDIDNLELEEIEEIMEDMAFDEVEYYLDMLETELPEISERAKRAALFDIAMEDEFYRDAEERGIGIDPANTIDSYNAIALKSTRDYDTMDSETYDKLVKYARWAKENMDKEIADRHKKNFDLLEDSEFNEYKSLHRILKDIL